MKDKSIKIEFKQTSNIFINTGIVGLYRYLKKFKRKRPDEFNFEFELNENSLVVQAENILDLLEEVYYFMGAELYDTSSKKQLDENSNAFYDIKTKSFIRFPKMKSYGLASLITNDPVPFMRNEEDSSTMKKLRESNPKLAEDFENYFQNNKLKLASKIYFNEPYIKITRLKLQSKFWIEGEKICPMTNESFKSLLPGINISPFFKGLNSFNSFIDNKDIEVSQKALLLLRFSPVLSMYTYHNGYDSFSASFFNSNNLVNINNLNKSDFFYQIDVMRAWKMPFKRNIKLHNFSYARKGKEDYMIETGDDSYSSQEITFLILLTFYKNKFSDELIKNDLNTSSDILSLLDIENIPLSLISFKADKFASTLRPNFYEEYTNAKFIIRLIHKLETNQPKRVPIKEIWRGLIFKTPQSSTIKDFNKRSKQERQIRLVIIDKVLGGKPILSDLANLFHKSFLQLANNNNPGYRRYDLLLEFLIIYESTINIMDKNLQLRAIKLGKSIGQAILNFDNPKNEKEKKANTKNGRKYLIGLNKARTIEQFRDSLIRIQNKYGVSIANDILENIDQNNFIAIKQYAQMGALNSINSVLSNNENQNQE